MPPPQPPPRSSRQCARCPGRPSVLRPCLSRHSKDPHASRARSAATIQHCVCNTHPASTRGRAASSRGTLRHTGLPGRLTVGFTSTANSAREAWAWQCAVTGEALHALSKLLQHKHGCVVVGGVSSRTKDVATGHTRGVGCWFTHSRSCCLTCGTGASGCLRPRRTSCSWSTRGRWPPAPRPASWGPP
jgi:hypothetical protein